MNWNWACSISPPNAAAPEGNRAEQKHRMFFLVHCIGFFGLINLPTLVPAQPNFTSFVVGVSSAGKMGKADDEGKIRRQSRARGGQCLA